MKETELMILDWVRSRTGMNVRIVGINHDHPGEYEPIPLTAEILEKNGTLLEVGDNGISTPSNQRNRYEKWLISSTWNSVNIWFDRHTKLYHVADMSRARFRHVHELQHALRLCGLIDLADNFKV